MSQLSMATNRHPLSLAKLIGTEMKKARCVVLTVMRVLFSSGQRADTVALQATVQVGAVQLRYL